MEVMRTVSGHAGNVMPLRRVEGSTPLTSAMKELILSLLTGTVVGALFQALRLPIPAPPILSGIVGIFGIYIGGVLVKLLW